MYIASAHLALDIAAAQYGCGSRQAEMGVVSGLARGRQMALSVGEASGGQYKNNKYKYSLICVNKL
jgi:hypothetical protein